jgi:NAD(P)-dependent dehydrogenase (short-subunit alcohol dehydrogenase family)
MADWRRIMAVNLCGAAHMGAALLPTLTIGSSAVFIGSLAGHTIQPEEIVRKALDDPLAEDFHERLLGALGREPSSNESYALSKFGVMQMCRRVAAMWGVRGARINSLSPGLIETPMGNLEFERQPMKYELLARTPLARQGTMLEVADALEFLCSDRASFITGTDLLVDGGIAAVLSR